MNSVCAVVVTYRPDNARLARALFALRETVEAIVVVDNGSEGLDESQLREACPPLILKRLHSNKGIASAQNQGIALARERNSRYILFLDQDSLPQPGMVRSLRAALEGLQQSGHQVACVGSRVRLPGSANLAGFSRLGWVGLRPVLCPHDKDVVECDFVLSSGTLVPLDVIDRVGGLEEKLFIDQVDTEWCLRARSMGYRVFGACSAILEHRLGERHARIWLGRWRYLPRHKPFRYYYIFRNSLLLFRRKYAPLKWIWFQLQLLGTLFLAYGILSRDRSGEVGMMLKGIVHGVRGIAGKLEDTAVAPTGTTAVAHKTSHLRTVPRPNCKLCGSGGEFIYQDLNDRSFSAPGIWQLRRCSNSSCGLLWLDPEPSEQDLRLAYQGYYTHGVSDPQDRVPLSRRLRNVARSSWEALLSPTPIMKERHRFETLFIDDLPPGDLLEVGFGAGSRLPLFRDLGWRVTGQELDAEAAAAVRRVNGVDIHVGPVEELAASGRRFDAIVMNHVIEHVLRPVEVLKTCLAMLREGGTLVCITPNASSWGHRAFGVNWLALDPPRHVTLFTPSNLRTAARMAGHSDPQVFTSCANAQAFAVGSFEIAAKRSYDMRRRPTWRSELLAMLAQLRALNEFRRDPSSGEELILRCRA